MVDDGGLPVFGPEILALARAKADNIGEPVR